MSDSMDRFGMGWLPDYPDFRDYTPEASSISPRLKRLGQQKPIKAMLTAVGVMGKTRLRLPATVDLREWCSPIENQGALGSCTANAGVGVVEYFERRAFGRHVDASRLFLYKVTRSLMHKQGDRGAFLRTTMGGLVLFGVPPEEHWPYDVSQVDAEPPAFCYAYTQSYQAISYYRLDPPGTTQEALLARIKANLAGGLPSMFGFTVYSSYTQAAASGKIPFPTGGEPVAGGHAIVAVGYDDGMKIRNANPGGAATTGAFLIRNSWGTAWGAAGYGWLPYEYVLSGLAQDWWSLLKNEWIDTGEFKV